MTAFTYLAQVLNKFEQPVGMTKIIYEHLLYSFKPGASGVAHIEIPLKYDHIFIKNKHYSFGRIYNIDDVIYLPRYETKLKFVPFDIKTRKYQDSEYTIILTQEPKKIFFHISDPAKSILDTLNLQFIDFKVVNTYIDSSLIFEDTGDLKYYTAATILNYYKLYSTTYNLKDVKLNNSLVELIRSDSKFHIKPVWRSKPVGLIIKESDLSDLDEFTEILKYHISELMK